MPKGCAMVCAIHYSTVLRPTLDIAIWRPLEETTAVVLALHRLVGAVGRCCARWGNPPEIPLGTARWPQAERKTTH